MIREIVFAATAIALVAFVPAPAKASEATSGDTTCSVMRTMAKNAMLWRQRDRSVSDYMAKHIEIIDGATVTEKVKGGLRTMVRIYAMEAYAEPVYMTPEFKQNIIEQFANEKEAECYRVVLKDTI